jgi:hypothetical protein
MMLYIMIEKIGKSYINHILFSIFFTTAYFTVLQLSQHSFERGIVQFPEYVVYARIIPAIKTVAHCSKSGPPNKWSTIPGSLWSGMEVYIGKKRRAGIT